MEKFEVTSKLEKGLLKIYINKHIHFMAPLAEIKMYNAYAREGSDRCCIEIFVSEHMTRLEYSTKEKWNKILHVFTLFL